MRASYAVCACVRGGKRTKAATSPERAREEKNERATHFQFLKTHNQGNATGIDIVVACWNLGGKQKTHTHTHMNMNVAPHRVLALAATKSQRDRR